MSSEQMEKRKPTPVDRLKMVLSSGSVEEQFRNALGDQMPLFIASLIDVYSGDSQLQQCNPGEVAAEALKAATLRLPINKSLGLAYIIAYKGRPSFQIGYKGLIQLAIRSGQYRYINADILCEGEFRGTNKLTGEIDIGGEAKSAEVIGAFAYLETLNGFRKGLFWSEGRIMAHAKRFSEAYKRGVADEGKRKNPWWTDKEAMMVKTVLKALISKYAILSVEMARAVTMDDDGQNGLEMAAEEAVINGEFVDVETGEIEGTVEETTPRIEF